MTKLIFLPHEEICPEGAVFDVEPGITICDAALQNGIEIEHACEKSCACTTCHVYVREGVESLNEATEDEDDLLDVLWGQFRVGQHLGDRCSYFLNDWCRELFQFRAGDLDL